MGGSGRASHDAPLSAMKPREDGHPILWRMKEMRLLLAVIAYACWIDGG